LRAPITTRQHRATRARDQGQPTDGQARALGAAPLWKEKHASFALASRPQRARQPAKPIPGTGVPPPACCPESVPHKSDPSAGGSGAFHTAPPPNSPHSGPHLRRGVAPVSRVIQEGVRGRTALGYRPNGRLRGTGRQASGVDAPGGPPGRSRWRRRGRPRHYPPWAAPVAWCLCCGGQGDVTWCASCSWRRSASPGAGHRGGVVSHKACFVLRACAGSPSRGGGRRPCPGWDS
jgi:hypothetical protein